MAIRTYKVTLDSKNSIAPEPVFLRQGDKTGAVVIDATLMDNGAPVSIDGLTPMFKAKTADGQAVIADSTGFNIVNASGGEFTYQIPNALSAVPGKITTAYFSFSDSSGSESTFDVSFVIKSAVDITHKQAEDYITIINGTLDSLRDQMDSLKIDFNKIINNYNMGDFYNKQETDSKDESTLASAKSYTADSINGIISLPETFTNLAAIKAKYPSGANGVMVAADNGHKYIWANNVWTDAGVYQSVGVADKSIDPIKLKTTSVVNNKSGKTYNLLSQNDDLYILNEPISEAGIVNVTGKFSSGTVYLYLLKKHSDKFIVIEKSVTTANEGWQSIFTNFYAKGGGDEYIGVLGLIYYAAEGGAGFYNYYSADNTSTEFITNQLMAKYDISLFTTIENSKLANVIDKKANELGAKIPINQFKNGIKDLLAGYTVVSNNTTYVLNDPLKQGNIIVHIKSSMVQNSNIYIVKKDNLRFTVLKKINIGLVVGENVIDMEYTSDGSGDEYIASSGFINYSRSGGFGFYEISQGSTVNNEGDAFNADDHTGITYDLAIYPEYKSDLNKKIEKISDDIDSVTPKLLLTDYTMPKYSEIVDKVGFVGRWFDTTIGGIPVKATINEGSELYFKVKNTTTINVNFVLNSVKATPYFAYSIDGSSMTRQLITTSKLPAVTTDEHIVRVIIDGLTESEDKWLGEKGVAFKDVTVDAGGVVTGIAPKNRQILFHGDSITEGVRVLNMNADSTGNSATGSFPYIASNNLNSISYRVGFGASGITQGGSGGVPELIQVIDKMTNAREAPYIEPDVVVMNMGTNDSAATTEVFTTKLNEVLDSFSIKYSGTPIFIMVPFNQARKTELTSAVSARSNMYLVETEGWNITTTDGTHPDLAGGLVAGNKLAVEIIKILGKNYFI